MPNFTADLVAHLCNELGHEEATSALVKKLVQEQKIKDLSRLREVPRERLEEWGIPLKLTYLMYDRMYDVEASEMISGASAFVNYTIRPGMSKMTYSFLDKVQKTVQPQEWAALRLQRWFRRRQERREMEFELANAPPEVEVFLSREDFRRPSEKQSYELRKKRAEERIRRFLRRYLARKRAAGRARAKPRLRQVERRTSVDLAAALEREASGPKIKNSAVVQLLMRLGRELPKGDFDVKAQVRSIVVQNWLEDLLDLDLAESRHWKAWGTPDKLVKCLHEAADDHRELLAKEAGGCWYEWRVWVRGLFNGSPE